MGRCSACGAQFEYGSLIKCSRCSLAHYCSKKCQKTDWSKHKALCDRIVADKLDRAAGKGMCDKVCAETGENQ